MNEPIICSLVNKLSPLLIDGEIVTLKMAAMVQWHRETLGMAALYHIPHAMSATPLNDPAKSLFQVCGTVIQQAQKGCQKSMV